MNYVSVIQIKNINIVMEKINKKKRIISMFKNNINKVILLGYVSEPQALKYTKNGIPVITLNLATTDTFKNKENIQEKITTWHNIIFYNTKALFVNNFIKKGFLIYVEGSIKIDKWDSPNGQKNLIKIIGSHIQIIDQKKKTDNEEINTTEKDEEFLTFDEKTPF